MVNGQTIVRRETWNVNRERSYRRLLFHVSRNSLFTIHYSLL